MAENKIKAIVHVINSKSDIYGNRYYAVVFTRTSDGAIAKGLFSGNESNCTSAMRQMYPEDWQSFQLYTSELKIKQWEKMYNDWPYIGCTNDELIGNILKQWDK